MTSVKEEEEAAAAAAVRANVWIEKPQKPDEVGYACMHVK